MLNRLASVVLLVSVFCLSLSAATCELECCAESSAGAGSHHQHKPADENSGVRQAHAHQVPTDGLQELTSGCRVGDLDHCRPCIQDELARSTPPMPNSLMVASPIAAVSAFGEARPASDSPLIRPLMLASSPPHSAALRI